MVVNLRSFKRLFVESFWRGIDVCVSGMGYIMQTETRFFLGLSCLSM